MHAVVSEHQRQAQEIIRVWVCVMYVCILCLHSFMPIYMHTYIYTCIHIHMPIHAYTYLYTYTHAHTCLYIHIYIYTCTLVSYASVCAVCTYAHTYMRTYLHTYTRTYIHAYIHTYTYIHAYINNIHTYIHAYINTYIYVYIHTYIYTYKHTYIYTCFFFYPIIIHTMAAHVYLDLRYPPLLVHVQMVLTSRGQIFNKIGQFIFIKIGQSRVLVNVEGHLRSVLHKIGRCNIDRPRGS